jgi:dihydrofolate reductase
VARVLDVGRAHFDVEALEPRDAAVEARVEEREAEAPRVARERARVAARVGRGVVLQAAQGAHQRRLELGAAEVALVAMADNGVIGRDNGLPWQLPDDLKRFKALTMGHALLMGRRTHDSIGRALPGRRNLVLSRNPHWQADGAERVDTIERALALAGADGAARMSVLGGAGVYALALPHADQLLLTEIDADLDGDTFFPPWPRAEFCETSREPHVGHDGSSFAFVTYDRVAP